MIEASRGMRPVVGMRSRARMGMMEWRTARMARKVRTTMWKVGMSRMTILIWRKKTWGRMEWTR